MTRLRNTTITALIAAATLTAGVAATIPITNDTHTVDFAATSDWDLPTNFGSTSKGGGTEILRIIGSTHGTTNFGGTSKGGGTDILRVYGSAEGNNI